MRHTETYYRLLPQWSPKNSKPLDFYKSNCTDKCIWICEKGHEWEASIKGRFSGHGCPYCGGRLPILGVNDAATVSPWLVDEWHPSLNRGKVLSDYLPYSEEMACWICKKGHVWSASILKRTAGHGCPICSKRIPGEKEHNLLVDSPEIARKWNYKRNKKGPEMYCPRSSSRVWWICENGHEWSASIHEMTAPKRNGRCAYCSGRKPIPGETDLATLYPDISAEWDYEFNRKKPSDYTAYSSENAHWICEKGHRYRALIVNRTRHGKGCAICNRGWEKL